MSLRRFLRRRRARRERGTVLVESAIVAPVFFVLTFGILEMGLLYRDYLTATSAVADAARIGAIVGPDILNAPSGDPVTADHEIVKALREGLASLDAKNVKRIVVFKSNGLGSSSPVDRVPNSCKAGVALPGRCNVYDPNTAFFNVSIGNTDYFSCSANPGGPACPWDPTTRDDGPDPADIEYVGVYIEIDREALTGFFQERYNIRDARVVRLEPGATDVG